MAVKMMSFGMKRKVPAFLMVAHPGLPPPPQENSVPLLAGPGARNTDAASRITLIPLRRRIHNALVAGNGLPVNPAARRSLLTPSLPAVISAHCPNHALIAFAQWV